MLKENASQSLRNLIKPGQLVTDPVELVTYEYDAGWDKGRPEAIVFPQSTNEVVRLVQWAVANGVPMVARGAGTGLSGGAVASHGGLVLEFSRMARMIELDTAGRSAVAEPGLPNFTLDELARQKGLYFPPDPSSQRASTIAGNVAENAGGPHCFKYGVTTNYVTGLELVLPDGRITRTGGQALDYPGYDLTGVLVGSEGTLALITQVDVRLVRNPPGVKTMMAIFDSLEQAGEAVSAVIAAGLVPATMELLDRNFARIIEEHAHAGIPTDAGAVMIVEVDGYPASLDPQIQQITGILTQYAARDLRVAQTSQERERIWYARKSAAGALSRLTPAYYMVDITVPRSRLAEMIAEANEICACLQIPVAYAFHAGDGNLHPVLLMMQQGDPDLVRRVHTAAEEMIRLAVSKEGSLTGEHGVGIEKREYMPIMYSSDEIGAMWDIKRVFDPEHRLNPGKIFPSAFAAHPGTEQYGQSTGPGSPGESNEESPRVYKPGSVSEAAKLLANLSAARKRVWITSGTAARDSGELVLSSVALTGVKAYAPDDLYVTVGAGTLLSELDAFLSEDQKQVPLASPWPQATVGGLIASNVNAPLRMRYGSVRDLVLAMTVALADGRILRAGRPVMKNVAGYDLPKLFVGSEGSLGFIADITLKLTPKPSKSRTLFLHTPGMEQALSYATRILGFALVASGILVYRETTNYVLAYTAEGMTEDVDAELAQVRCALREAGAPEPVESDGPTATETWVSRLSRAEENALLVRLGVPPKSLNAFLKQAPRPDIENSIVDVASGLVYLSVEPASSGAVASRFELMRQAAQQAGGYAAIMTTSGQREGYHDGLDCDAAALELMQRLKRKWDPAGILVSRIFG